MLKMGWSLALMSFENKPNTIAPIRDRITAHSVAVTITVTTYRSRSFIGCLSVELL